MIIFFFKAVFKGELWRNFRNNLKLIRGGVFQGNSEVFSKRTNGEVLEGIPVQFSQIYWKIYEEFFGESWEILRFWEASRGVF